MIGYRGRRMGCQAVKNLMAGWKPTLRHLGLGLWISSACLAPAKDQVEVFADFEGWSTRPFSGGKRETKTPIEGKGSLHVGRSYVTMKKRQDWSAYDYVRFDVFNPREKPAKLYVEVRDKETKDYWTRANMYMLIQPGRQEVRFPTALYVGEKSSRGRPLLRDQITHFILNVGNDGPLVFDNFQLIKVDLSKVVFPGLKAFDFGPPGSPVLEGFTPVDQEPYSKKRGYGWVDARIWRSHNVYHPEPATQDFVCPMSGMFRIDLPNGVYHLHLNIESPGGYWGEVPAYRKRMVKANGRGLIGQKMIIERFLKQYFVNANAEDTPDVDPFSKYVYPKTHERSYEVLVTDGVLELEFLGGGYAISLTHLFVYPRKEGARGKAFFDWVKERRKRHFDAYFKQQTKPRVGARPPDRGYALFSRPSVQAVDAEDGPLSGEPVGTEGLSLTVLRGEEAALTFSVQSTQTLDRIEIETSALKNEHGTVLDPSVLSPGWLDYRISRQNLEGTMYAVSPRYWHPVPAPFTPGITRRFWIRCKPGEATDPGTYRGAIQVRPEGAAPSEIPVSIQVSPIDLAPITDVAVGPWGCRIDLPWLNDEPGVRGWNDTMFERSLEALRAIGCTSFSGAPMLRTRAEKGKIRLNTKRADRQMALIRAQGFNHLISSYGITRIGYHLYEGVTEKDARTVGFDNADEYLRAFYRAVDRHAVENDWVPVAWNLCDEPGGDALRRAERNARHHARVAKGLKRTTFMGATAFLGGRGNDPHRALATSLPIASLNPHDEPAIEAIRAAGNRFSFYNGASRWTLGYYMRMLVKKHEMALRLTWHYNNAAGDPYYALDCREDDYCWFNTNENMELVPSAHLLAVVVPGLNDYRYAVTLEQHLERAKTEKRDAGAIREAQALLDGILALTPGRDRHRGLGADEHEARREEIRSAILRLKGEKR